MRRLEPRPLEAALQEVALRVAPATTLARAQRAWGRVGGASIARESEPVAEHDGVITVACRSAPWAQELELMSRDLVARLNEALGSHGTPPPVRAMRFVTRSGAGG